MAPRKVQGLWLDSRLCNLLGRVAVKTMLHHGLRDGIYSRGKTSWAETCRTPDNIAIRDTWFGYWFIMQATPKDPRMPCASKGENKAKERMYQTMYVVTVRRCVLG